MFSFAIAAVAVLQSAVIAPTATADNTLTPTGPRSTVVATARANAIANASASDHLDSARRALANGAFDVARREYVIAAALDRDAGRLPAEATFGLAQVLYAQSYNREAAIVLAQLAQEAAKAGDVDVEARARLDAMWLNLDAGQRDQARADASRLRTLMADVRLSEDTRRQLKARLG